MNALSVVIPAVNEQAAIGAVLDRVVAGDPGEVIVADGGSTDGTPSIARGRGATVVASAPGRGRQLRAGVAAARGRVLLLLHADTRLPEGYAVDVEQVLDRPGVVAGAFRLRIDSPRRALRLVERAVDVRSRGGGMPYGDQALFLRARVLETVGGVPDLPAMEDYELVRRLRRRGRIEIAPSCVTTSARRWRRHGVWRTTALNQWCIIAYRLGVDPARIARWRWNAEAAFPNRVEEGRSLSPTGGSP